MERYTVLLMPEGTGTPRRLRVRKSVARRSAIAAATALVVLLGIAVDYVRVRIDVLELDALRRETREQRARIQEFSSTLSDLEAQLARVREFEHKVRLIADLPRSGGGDGLIGVGGGPERPLYPASPAGEEEPAEGEADNSGAAGAADPAPEALPGQEDAPGPQARAAGPAAPEPGAQPAGSPTAVRIARLRLTAGRLDDLTRAQARAMADLVSRLDDKRLRLASTPSIWPTEGWLTSVFGYRTSPFTGRRQFHAGIDVAARPGTAIVAPARGRVAYTGRKGPLGRSVVIEHGFGIRTTYGHIDEVHVKKGQEVERGQAIAAVGSSGRSTGPHLHYSVELDGRAVNPLNYILD